MRKRRRTYDYKFTEKEHSLRGMVGLILALLSLAGSVVMIMISARAHGAGSVYLGSGGIFLWIVAIAALILAAMSMREENSYRIFPVLSLGFSVIAVAWWILLYLQGIFGIL